MRLPLLILLLLPLLTTAQNPVLFDPDSILIGNTPPTKILLVGTFHFDYPGLDNHKTSREDQVDVLSPRRAEEVAELNDYLARFRPTKIIVERDPGSALNDSYRSYLRGQFELTRDEIHQIAFRLGERFGIDSLIAGDADDLARDLYYGPDSVILQPMLDSLYADTPASADTSLDARYYQLYAHDDKLRSAHSLLEDFQYMNSTQRIRRGHGHYLEFTSDTDPDALAIGWYSRNLRIYRNIQRAATSAEDRILVLFGAGHLGILRQQVESSPRFELVEFGSL